ncbi:MAG: bacteriohemerythrin [Candidatus Liptonbacteria bacterium]
MKKTFVWTEEYSVHVAELDEQHREFINICNGLIDLAESALFAKDEALTEVMKLGDYAVYHLSTEEELFAKISYPDAVPHTESHNQFREKAKIFIDKTRAENADIKRIAEAVAEFAAEWLLNHILHVDKKYSEFFNQHGIK